MSSIYLICVSDGSEDYWWPAEYKDDKKKKVLSSVNTNLIIVKTIISNLYIACDLDNDTSYEQYDYENKVNEPFFHKILDCLDKYKLKQVSNLNKIEKENICALRQLFVDKIDAPSIKCMIDDLFNELETFEKGTQKKEVEKEKKQRRKERRKQIQNDNKANKQQQTKQQQKSAGKVLKRSNVIAWDDYFMAVAFLSSMRSKDPSTQVGACIVDSDNRIIGIGYNGFPRGCSDDVLSWAREAENELDTKYPYVCHAEVNAILNKNIADARGCTIYVALFPCNECAKMIIQSGISEVVYLSDKYHDTPSMTASRRMFDLAGVKQRQLTPNKEAIEICFECSASAAATTADNNALPIPTPLA